LLQQSSIMHIDDEQTKNHAMFMQKIEEKVWE
jgi:hypothetical protein